MANNDAKNDDNIIRADQHLNVINTAENKKRIFDKIKNYCEKVGFTATLLKWQNMRITIVMGNK